MVEQRLNLNGMLTFTLRGGRPINLSREQVPYWLRLRSSFFPEAWDALRRPSLLLQILYPIVVTVTRGA